MATNDPLAAAGSAEMRDRIKAYPGTLTFLDLIRKNKRDSAALMIIMVVFTTVLGASLITALAVWSGAAPDARSLLPSIVLGALASFVVAVLGATWSWFGGAGAILGISGAQEIEKADDPQLFNVVEELSIAAGVPMPRVYVIDDSAMNAFATGRDPRHAAVAITTGLRRVLNRDELQGVLAHEMSHVRHLDIRYSMLMATMVGLIVFACDAFWRILWFGRPGMVQNRRDRGDGEGGAGVVKIVLLVVAILLSILAPIVAAIIQMAYSRQREYLADAGAVELTRNPLGLASALQKLADDPDPFVDAANRGTAHLYIVNPLRKMRETQQAVNSMFLSHPPIRERIARLLALTR
jgi:heat shock protein HtpX